MSIIEVSKEVLAKVKENGLKQKRTPRNYDSIVAGALALTLGERVQLKKQLTESIQFEVREKKAEAEVAEKIAQE